MKTHVGGCVEGGNSIDVTPSAHISNTNFFLHASSYSNNHRKKTCSRFWSVRYLKTSPKLPPHISVQTRTPTSLQEPSSHMNSPKVGEQLILNPHQRWTMNKNSSTMLIVLSMCYNSFDIALCT